MRHDGDGDDDDGGGAAAAAHAHTSRNHLGKELEPSVCWRAHPRTHARTLFIRRPTKATALALALRSTLNDDDDGGGVLNGGQRERRGGRAVPFKFALRVRASERAPRRNEMEISFGVVVKGAGGGGGRGDGGRGAGIAKAHRAAIININSSSSSSVFCSPICLSAVVFGKNAVILARTVCTVCVCGTVDMRRHGVHALWMPWRFGAKGRSFRLGWRWLMCACMLVCINASV